MKQIAFHFTIADLTNMVIFNNLHNLEDGFWELSFATESITANIPCFYTGQDPNPLPGHVVRITGARLTRIMDPTCSIVDNSTCMEVRNGQIVQRTPDGVNQSNDGSSSDSEGNGKNGRITGGNKRSSGSSIPAPKTRSRNRR